ncbi:542_t:CDS:2 [Paraglomus occultum]|uniref:542_t:CDS:1 n=1 Tax=Paraglomus occultum TaxID=144539 RepID=A0A9N8ZSJ6_9GLOM|nr:542_t:CDS:2 [Paraglomus occultum]
MELNSSAVETQSSESIVTSETSKPKNQETQFKGDADDVLISLKSCDDYSQHRYTPSPRPLVRDEVDILLCDIEIPSKSAIPSKSVTFSDENVERTSRFRANGYPDWDTKRCPPNIHSQSPVYDDYAYQYRNATSSKTPTTRNFHSNYSPAYDNYIPGTYIPYYHSSRPSKNCLPSRPSRPQRHSYTFCEMLAYSMSPAARTIVNGFSPDALDLLQTDSCKSNGTFPPHFECKAFPSGMCNKVVRNRMVSKDDRTSGLYIIPPHRSGVFYNAEEFMNLFLDAQNRWIGLLLEKECCVRDKLNNQIRRGKER